MEDKNGVYNFKLLILLFFVFVGVGLIINNIVSNYGVVTITVSGQIFDDKETTTIEKIEAYGEPYMVKYEKDGEYYIELKHSGGLPSKLKCSKEEYDRIKSGCNYYMQLKYKESNQEKALLLGVYDNEPGHQSGIKSILFPEKRFD